MKNIKKKIAILCAVMLTMGVLVACGGSADTPSEVVTSFLTAIQNGDAQAASELSADDDFDWDMEAMSLEDAQDEIEIILAEAVNEKVFEFVFEVLNEDIDGDRATVEVEITAYNFSDMFNNWIEAYFASAFELAMAGGDEEEIEALGLVYLEDALADMAKDFTATVELELVKVDGQWLVDEMDEDSDLIDAISGGLISMAMGW